LPRSLRNIQNSFSKGRRPLRSPGLVSLWGSAWVHIGATAILSICARARCLNASPMRYIGFVYCLLRPISLVGLVFLFGDNLGAAGEVVVRRVSAFNGIVE